MAVALHGYLPIGDAVWLSWPVRSASIDGEGGLLRRRRNQLQCRASAHRAILQTFDLLDLDEPPGSRPLNKGHRRILCNPKLLLGVSQGAFQGLFKGLRKGDRRRLHRHAIQGASGGDCSRTIMTYARKKHSKLTT